MPEEMCISDNELKIEIFCDACVPLYSLLYICESAERLTHPKHDPSAHSDTSCLGAKWRVARKLARNLVPVVSHESGEFLLINSPQEGHLPRADLQQGDWPAQHKAAAPAPSGGPSDAKTIPLISAALCWPRPILSIKSCKYLISLLLWRVADQACLIAQYWQLALAKFLGRRASPWGECIFGSTHSSPQEKIAIFLLVHFFCDWIEFWARSREQRVFGEDEFSTSSGLEWGDQLLFCIEINFSSWAHFAAPAHQNTTRL